MSILYHVLRTVEIVVTMAAAVKMLTCPYEMRWNGIAAKILFGIFWTFGAALPVLNGFYCKVSGIEYVIVTCYSLVVIFVFYRIPILNAVANELMFWGTLFMIRYAILIIVSGKMKNGDINAYNMDFSQIHFMELVESIVIVDIILFFLRREQPILPIQKKWECWGGIFLGIGEWYIAIVGLPYDKLNPEKYWQDARIAALMAILVLCVCAFYAMCMFYIKEKRILQLLQLKDSMLEEQIACMKENYELKRKQIHDCQQQNLLLKGYLAQGKIDEACQYLEKLQDGLKETKIKGETGITSIDIMLHYKRQQAERQGVSIIADIRLYDCPIEHNDICIILGNLLDNAIEAAAELKENKREVQLRIQVVNHMFLLSVENHYKGNRRRWEGEYITTKPDKGSHGIGLKSSRRIVEKYGGSFKIKDDGSIFRVEAIILSTERKEEKEYGKESGTEELECGRKFMERTERNG